jgi:lipopolysaccharide biosynthesis protein
MVTTTVREQREPEVATPKILAFVLPQFHRIPENDQWWGDGFTEWTNVRKATALFAGHYQPRVPANNHYYDLLDPRAHDWQAALAKEYGVHGFCYYHYWFRGKQLLERPIELLLRRGQPDIPFCFAWANEPWTRAWDGGDHQVLMPQSYGDEADWRRHFDYLLQVFRDERYIRVDGKPMLLIYRSTSIEVLEPMLRLWRQLARDARLPGLHIVEMLTGFNRDAREPLFDAFAEFEPMYTIRHCMPYWFRKREKWRKRLMSAARRLLGRWLGPPYSYDYRSLWTILTARTLPPRTYPGIFVDWDNSPRRGLERGMVMRNFDARSFDAGVRAQLRKAQQHNAEFVFVNAWNEWAEGAYLEPDEGRGLLFLETIRAAIAVEIDGCSEPMRSDKQV